MLHISVRLAFAGFSVVALFSSVASAQSTISGQAKDSSGAVMAGVSVEAASPALIERSRAVVTNGEGRYPSWISAQAVIPLRLRNRDLIL